MANREQLDILKQGVKVWNKWRKENLGTRVNLVGANLSGINLSGARLWAAGLLGANLTEANLRDTNLGMASLMRANLKRADLTNAHLKKANLWEAGLADAILWWTDFRGANLKKADLSRADFMGTYLNGTNLVGANLEKTVFRYATVAKANFSDAMLLYTSFGFIDLSKVVGLDEVDHRGPSIVGHETMKMSKGQIPEAFLRGCGLSDWEIESVKLYNPDLSNEEITQIQYDIYELRAGKALQISPLFISYNHEDSEFVDKIGDSLIEKGIRFWRDVHHATAGRLEKQIDRAIRQNPTVLVVLSSNSIRSDWVQHEVRIARELEKELGHDTLCPVALDDSWKSSPWPKRVMEQVMEYNILDFSAWRDDSKFEDMFRRLIDGLELFYKG